jgi:hypothetical protein
MRVRMREIMSGPDGTVHPGQETEVPDAVGEQLIKNRFAEAVPEVATEALEGTETARQPEPKPRKKGGGRKRGADKGGDPEKA